MAYTLMSAAEAQTASFNAADPWITHIGELIANAASKGDYSVTFDKPLNVAPAVISAVTTALTGAGYTYQVDGNKVTVDWTPA